MPGFPPVPHVWTEPTPSFPPESTAQPLPVSSANPCSLLLPRALFASKPWTLWGSPLMLQEVRRQNYEAQSLEKSGIQARYTLNIRKSTVMLTFVHSDY